MVEYLRRQNKFIAFVLIFILGFIVYSNSLNGDFVWDDEILVKDNIYIKDWSKVIKLFAGDFGPGSFMKGYLYRPIQMITYTVDYSFWGLRAIGYHLTNIFLHILVALAIYRLTNILFNTKILSFLTSILFVVHPVHTEAVTYISGRADSLAALFILLCLIFYIKQTTSLKKRSMYFLILFSYLLAVLSKEYSLITPMLLLVYSYTFEKKILVKEFLSILCITLIYIILRVIFIPSHTISTGNFFQRIPGFFVAIAEYLRLLLRPFNLHMEYGNKLFNFHDAKAIVGVSVVLLLLMYAFLKRKNDKLMVFSIFWFFVSLLPVSNLYPINAYMAEHWLYLPSIGFFIILAKFFTLLYRTKIKYLKSIAIISITCILFFYSYLTIKQNNYWKNNLSFSKWTLRYVSDSSRLYGLVCKTCIEAGDIKKAEIFCQKAIETDPQNPSAYSLLGVIFGIKGLYKESISYFEKAINIDPTYVGAYNDLGITHARMANFVEAKRTWENGLKINPESLVLQDNLRRLEQK